jgi:uncharacterized protein with PQ loop repeat
MNFECPKDSEVCRILLKFAVPIIGNIFSIAMVLAPLSRVRQVAKTSRLAGLNPLPYGWQMSNAMGWLLYGLYTRNVYVALPNLVGFSLASYYIFTVLANGAHVRRRLCRLIRWICSHFPQY